MLFLAVLDIPVLNTSEWAKKDFQRPNSKNCTKNTESKKMCSSNNSSFNVINTDFCNEFNAGTVTI